MTESKKDKKNVKTAHRDKVKTQGKKETPDAKIKVTNKSKEEEASLHTVKTIDKNKEPEYSQNTEKNPKETTTMTETIDD